MGPAGFRLEEASTTGAGSALPLEIANRLGESSSVCPSNSAALPVTQTRFPRIALPVGALLVKTKLPSAVSCIKNPVVRRAVMMPCTVTVWPGMGVASPVPCTDPMVTELHGGTGFTISERVALAGPVASLTMNVIMVVPIVVGTPLSTPVEVFNIRLAGNIVEDHVRVPLPPLAVRVTE